MFRRNKTSQPTVCLERVKIVSERASLTDYGDVTRAERAPRTSVYKQATLTLLYGEKVPVAIKNLSSTGARVEFFQNRRLGERVLITEASVPLRFWADVVWEVDGAGGLRFKERA
jgi:hypothetical protein